MPVSANLRHQNSTVTPSNAYSQHAMNGSVTQHTPFTALGFQESRRRRQTKPSTRLDKGLTRRAQTSSPYQANNMNATRRPMHGSSVRPRAGSYTSSEDANSMSALTRTGRPSKALKGKPVHRCDVCEKVYTRNEHLSEDGFVRAQSPRHHEDDSAGSRIHKRKSARPTPAHNHQDEPVATAFDDSPALGIPLSNVQVNEESTHLDASYHHSRAASQIWDPTSEQSSPGVFGSARHEFFNSIGPTWTPFETQITNTLALPPAHSPDDWHHHNGSRSPGSTTSSLRCAWPLVQEKQFRSSFSPTESNQSGYTSYGTPGAENTVPNMTSDIHFFEDQDTCDDGIIAHEVRNMAQSIPGLEGQARLEQLEGHYLEAFWTRFNPMFTIMHRHTFDYEGTSPLVRALMIAIGAQFFDDEAAQTMARTLREACAKAIHRRSAHHYNYSRLWDWQVVFLHEAFSVYCSRRPSSRFSQAFEDLLTGLLYDSDNRVDSHPLNTLSTFHNGSLHGAAGPDPRRPWIHLESKRRLLLACYVLEIQQNKFFGSHRPISETNLPLPCSSELWEAYAFEDWQKLTYQEQSDSRSLSDSLAVSHTGTSQSDPFFFNIAVAYNAHCALPFPVFCPTEPAHRLAQTQKRQCAFTSSAAQLALATPVHEVLAVSGDTFVLGQKLATREQFEQAVADLQAWIVSPGAAEAVRHAQSLLKIVLEGGRVGLLCEDWVVSLAALVVWAMIMWPVQQHGNGVVPAQALGSAQEVLQRTRAAVVAPGMEYEGARACLAFAKGRMQGRLGWLAQDTGAMLGKLLENNGVGDGGAS